MNNSGKSVCRARLFALVLALGSGVCSAQYELEREMFLSAEKALHAGNLEAFTDLKDKLSHYPLLPYLEYQQLERRLHRLPANAVNEFLVRYQDVPISGLLRNRWLHTLAAQARWKTFLAFYRGGRNLELRCHYLHALIDTGAREKAFSLVEPIWLHGRSRPDACDPVFDAWRAAGRQTQDLTWKRIALAMRLGEHRLASYLGRYLTPPDQKWLQRWITLHHRPQQALNGADFEQTHVYRTAMLAHAVKRQASRDALSALEMWRTLQARHQFEPNIELVTERRLALALARVDHPTASHFVEQVQPCSHDRRLQESRLLSALASGDWPRLLQRLERLPLDLAQSERWRYWRARALARTGETAAAETIYRTLAQERSFYGFLAADRIGTEYNLLHEDTPIDSTRMAELANAPAAVRARELRAVSRLIQARREWYHFTRNLPQSDQQVAAELAERWQWHDQAIFTLARTGYWDDLELRFPLAHRGSVERNATAQNLDDAWVFAVIRQESAFMEQARSPVGALGLMQLMPRTARDVAKKTLGKRAPRRSDLFEPGLNIQLGSAYLRQVLDHLGGHQVLALAAYNAGPHRVKAWLPEISQDADVWIELVPFRETRGYLRRVLAYTAIYEKRLGKTPTRLSKRMPMVMSAEEMAAATGQSTDSSG